MTRASDTARLVSGGAVLNEASNDVDFRVESDGNANMFIVDGGQNKVGIGVSPAKGMLHIQPSARTTNFSASDHTTYADIYVHNPTDDDTCATGIAFATDASSFDNGASGIACISGTGDSESSLAFITRPNGAVAAEAMRIDSSQNVGIGTTSPETIIHATATSAIVRLTSATNGTSGVDFGDSDDTNIGRILYDNSDNSMAFTTNTSEAMRILSGGNVGIGRNNPATALDVDGGANSDHATFSGTASRGLKISTFSVGAADEGVDFDAQASGSTQALTFSTGGTERIRVDGSGNLIVGATGAFTSGSGNTGGSGAIMIARDNERCLLMKRSSGNGEVVNFLRGGTTNPVGTISITTTATAYNTSSDYRLKENVVTDWDATARLKQLKPSRFNFKTDKDNTVDGFLAHEVSSIVPEAISGEKDAVDKDGNPEYQGIDQSKLVPLMVKTIQELEARIATLESK